MRFLTLVMVFQLAGEVMARLLSLPVPGPVIGLVLFFVGSVTAIAVAVAIPWALGASAQTLISLAPKSATAPVAMGPAAQLGGAPSLTAAVTILTGITGAICGTAVLNLLRVRDPRARGLAVGVAAHGIGTARKMQITPVARSPGSAWP